MQQESKCVAKERLSPVSDSLFKNQSLIKDYLEKRTPIVTYSTGENVNVSQSFGYNDLKL